MRNYAKALVAAVGAVALLVHAAVQDKAISFDEASGIWQAVIAAATALGVYSVPNRTA